MASIARTSTGLEGAILIHPDGTVVTGTGTGGGGSTILGGGGDAAANGDDVEQRRADGDAEW